MNVKVKIENGSDMPGMPYSVNVYYDDRQVETTAVADYDQARVYAKGLRDGYRLARHAIPEMNVDYGRQLLRDEV